MGTCKLTVILTTHKKLGFIEYNVEKLKRICQSEIIIAADEPEEEILQLIKRYNLKATVSNERRGKWRALNDALKLATCDYILFIDSDTKIEFNIDELLKCFEKYDAIEIGKEVNASSLIEKLARIDYLNMFITSKLSSKLNSCLGLNGAAFAIKRDIIKKFGFRARINEDTDLGLRLAINGYKVGVFGKTITKSPSTFKSWLMQRERWAIAVLKFFLRTIRRF